MTLPVPRTKDLAHWDPLREFEDLTGQMNSLFESAFGRFPMFATVTGWVPAVDIEETDDAFVVEAELPGVKREDIQVELREGDLIISGELKERERVGVLRRRTRRTGQFSYCVFLPGETDAEKISASLADGVLTVTVPKGTQGKSHKVEVTQG
jgi:HSP20 family protein